MSNNNLVPDNVKNIAQRASPAYLHTTPNEKMVAVAQLQAIRDYVSSFLTQLDKVTKK